MDKSLVLNEIKSHLGFRKDAQLATFLGIKHNTLASWRARNSIDYELIVAKCEWINTDFLLRGKLPVSIDGSSPTNQPIALTEDGKVNGKESAKNSNLNGNLPPKSSEVITAFQPPTVVVVDSNQEPNIIMVDTKAAAGMAVGYADPAYYQDKPTFSLPELKNGQYWCVQITGDSMHPTVKDKEWVIGKKVLDINHIVSGKVYLLLTDEGVVCKRLYLDAKKDHFKVVSDNDTYAPYKEPLSGVIAVFEATKKLTDDFRNWSTDVRKDIYNMKTEIAELNRRSTKIEDLEVALKKAGLL